ncbi:hypothetical protein NO136_20450, partial [Clostridioides difficile]|nr:hypothetical protein [Clostridioides difficile]
IAEPFKATTPELAALGEAALWPAIETTNASLLVVRGETSDLLSRETVADMMRRGRHVTHAEVPGAGHAPAFID